MIINVRVFTKAKKNIIKEAKSGLKVYVKKSSRKGLANVAVIDLLSMYLKVKKYRINVISGQHSKDRLIEIPD